MKAAKPYTPKPKRDPRVGEMFWHGVYLSVLVGLLAGAALWGFLLLGGAPLVADRARAMATLISCALFGAAALCAWGWGRRGLELSGEALVNAAAPRVAWLVWAFTPESDEYDRAEETDRAGRRLVRGLLALPVGVPLMIAFATARKARPFAPGALWGLSALGAGMWILLAVAGWQRLMPQPAPLVEPVEPSVVERAEADQAQAEMDSALELAVARARRAKAQGNKGQAMRYLEDALRSASIDGRSVRHVQLHRNLAWLYAEGGNPAGAMVMFRMVLELADPGSDEQREAEAALKRLAFRSGLSASPASSPSQVLAEDRDEEAAGE